MIDRLGSDRGAVFCLVRVLCFAGVKDCVGVRQCMYSIYCCSCSLFYCLLGEGLEMEYLVV